MRWKGKKSWVREVKGDLNEVNNELLNEESGGRPGVSVDKRNCP